MNETLRAWSDATLDPRHEHNCSCVDDTCKTHSTDKSIISQHLVGSCRSQAHIEQSMHFQVIDAAPRNRQLRPRSKATSVYRAAATRMRARAHCFLFR